MQNGYSGDNVRQKFTAKERYSETGLDYFLAILLVDAGSLYWLRKEQPAQIGRPDLHSARK